MPAPCRGASLVDPLDPSCFRTTVGRFFADMLRGRIREEEIRPKRWPRYGAFNRAVSP